MWISVFLVTLTLSSIGFLSNEPIEMVFNPLYTYYFYAGRYMWTNASLFFWLWMMVVLYFIIFQKFKNEITFRQKIAVGMTQSALVMILGFLLSAIVIFTVALVEMNILAWCFNISPKSLGVIMDKTAISEKLNKFVKPPKIITAEPGDKTELLAVATAMAGVDNFYGSFILPKFPKFLIWPVNLPDSSLLLIDETLVVTHINHQDLQDISSEIGYLFVKYAFPSRDIRYYPKISLLDKDGYKEFRLGDYAKRLKMVDALLVEAEAGIGNVESEIERLGNSISQIELSIKQIYTSADNGYFKCMNSAEVANCESQRAKANEQAVEKGRLLDTEKENLEAVTKELADQRMLVEFYKSQRKIGEALEANIPSERGLFDPPDGIKLTWEDPKAGSVADYFESLTHEYLHYASYMGEEKKLADPFFEEGLTEYYARKAIADNLQLETNLGYPVVVKIISKIAKNIPDSDLANIYFFKDQEALETILDRVYGDGFYKSSRVIFATLMYSQDPQKILPMANLIMEKIKGEQLTENDLLSTFSDLSKP